MKKPLLGLTAIALVVGISALYIRHAHGDPRSDYISKTLINAPAMEELRATAVNVRKDSTDDVAPAAMRAQRADAARLFLRKYHDPVWGEELFQKSMRATRPQYAGLERALGLEREEADALIELLVRQDLARQEVVMRCIAETGSATPASS